MYSAADDVFKAIAGRDPNPGGIDINVRSTPNGDIITIIRNSTRDRTVEIQNCVTREIDKIRFRP